MPSCTDSISAKETIPLRLASPFKRLRLYGNHKIPHAADGYLPSGDKDEIGLRGYRVGKSLLCSGYSWHIYFRMSYKLFSIYIQPFVTVRHA